MVFTVLWAVLCVLPVVQAQEIVTVTTYYPSPDGVYKVLRLMPRSDFGPLTNCNAAGQMFYHQTSNRVYFCDGTNWILLGDDIWSLDGNYLHAGDPAQKVVNDGIAIGASIAPDGSYPYYCSSHALYIYGDSLQLKNVNGDATVRLESIDRSAFLYGPGSFFSFGNNLYGAGGRWWSDGAISWETHHQYTGVFAIYGGFEAENLFSTKAHIDCPNDSCSTTVNFLPAGRFSRPPVVTCSAGPRLDVELSQRGSAPTSCSTRNKTANSVDVYLSTHNPNRAIGGWMTVYVTAIDP